MTHIAPPDPDELDTLATLDVDAPPRDGDGPEAGRLRLRRLVVHGFKSFADKTEFVFDRPVTGIVGPNGCGKSNVVDAVKWVLGEQSARSLRGGAMLDVIFNGAATRQAGSAAEVTLFFDNPTGPPADDGRTRRPLPVDVDEVAVGRVLLRDGTSHYRINGRNARLKDVRELFLDTGVGVDAYSVIEQGRVARMLEATGAERRVLFEEAAGVSRFKARRKEASAKLDRVEQNLLRLGDVVDGVERQLRGVRQQAGKARSYQELSTRLSLLRRRLARHEFEALSSRLEAAEAEAFDAGGRAESSARRVTEAEARVAEAREQAASAADAVRGAERRHVESTHHATQAGQRARFVGRQVEQLGGQVRALTDDRTRAADRHAAADAAADEDRRLLAEASAALEAAKVDLAARQEAHRAASHEANDVTARLDAARSASLEAMNVLAAADRRLAAVEIERRNADDAALRSADRRARLESDLAEARQTVETLDGEVAGRRADLAAAEADWHAARTDGQALVGDLGRLAETLVHARETRGTLAGRQKVLLDLEKRHEGVGDAVRRVLERREEFPFVGGIVADVLRVDVDHAPAVEAALDGRDAWIIVRDADALASRARDLPPGTRYLLPADAPADASVPPGTRPGDPPVRLLRDLVRTTDGFGWVADALLAGVAVVPTLGDALHLRRHVPAGWRYVTRDGDLLDAAGGLRLGGQVSSGTRDGRAGPTGLVARRAQLADVSTRLQEADAEVARLQAELEAGNARRAQLEREAGARREKVFAARSALVEVEGAASRGRDRVKSLGRELPAVEREAAESAARGERSAAEARSLDATRRKASSRLEAARQAAAAAEAGYAQAARQMASLADALTAARVTAGAAQEQENAARRAADRHAQQMRESAEQVARVDAALREAAGRADELSREKSAAEDEQAAHAASAVRAGEEVAARQSAATQTRQAVADADRVAADARSAQQAADAHSRDAATRVVEVRLRRDALVERFRDETGLELADVPVDNGIDDGLLGFDPAAAADEVRTLAERLSRLGNVNLDAIGELEALEKRSAELATQTQDLRSAKKKLESLIDDLNAECGRRFAETFQAVRGHFQQMFRKLFGGGKADVFLQTSVDERVRDAEGNLTTVTRQVDPLDAGIEVVASPPGKKPVTISQLSGGEKTMTCVALLMSLFRSRPSPFCILDEVDAALDEANNLRFNRIVEEFVAQSQFILITHSKRTMRVADVLYGVTMQEQGVSRRVSVRFDQVNENGRIDAVSVGA